MFYLRAEKVMLQEKFSSLKEQSHGQLLLLFPCIDFISKTLLNL